MMRSQLLACSLDAGILARCARGCRGRLVRRNANVKDGAALAAAVQRGDRAAIAVADTKGRTSTRAA